MISPAAKSANTTGAAFFRKKTLNEAFPTNNLAKSKILPLKKSSSFNKRLKISTRRSNTDSNDTELSEAPTKPQPKSSLHPKYRAFTLKPQDLSTPDVFDVIEDKRNEFFSMLNSGNPQVIRQLKRYIRRKSCECTACGGSEIKKKRGHLIVLPYEYADVEESSEDNIELNLSEILESSDQSIAKSESKLNLKELNSAQSPTVSTQKESPSKIYLEKMLEASSAKRRLEELKVLKSVAITDNSEVGKAYERLFHLFKKLSVI